MLRYHCLVLDHDDTTVDSTRAVNYPQFREALTHFRPELHISEDEFFRYCFDPGFYSLCTDILHYTPEELQAHTAMWKEYHKTHRPRFFPGMAELIQRQKDLGGLVCVVSHSDEDVIRAAYQDAGVIQPDLVFGGDQPAERRKPNPWPLQEILRRYDLRPDQALMVDDMPHGGHMSREVGVEFACAGWYGMLPEIETYMRQNCDYFFGTVAELADFLFR